MSHSILRLAEALFDELLRALDHILKLGATGVRVAIDSDRCGAKRVYIGRISAFTLASMLSGTSSSARGLIAARILQGMDEGLLAP